MRPQTLPHDVLFLERADNGFSVIETPLTLILDWDIKKPETETTKGGTEQTEPSLVEVPALTEEADNVESGCCTISCTQDAIARLEAHYQKSELWAVYQTGNGVRAFRLDKDFLTTDPELQLLTDLLVPDKHYIDRSVERSRWAARVSHKPERPDEQISFLQWIGNGEPRPRHMEVLECHHQLLLEHSLTDVPFSAVAAALEAHLHPPREDYENYIEFWS